MDHVRTTKRAIAIGAIVLCTGVMHGQTVQSLSATSSTIPLTDISRPVAGPLTLPLNHPGVVDLGITLEKGRKYTIVVQGTGATRRQYPGGVDPVYRTADRNLPAGEVRPFNSFKLPAPNTTFYDTIKKSIGVAPHYNPMHIYHVTITGDGKPLKAWLEEASVRNYTDNSGAFTITVFHAPKAGTDKPAAPLIDADVGG